MPGVSDIDGDTGAKLPTMTAVAFDTYALVRRLKASGLSEDQAEAITGALKDGRDSDLAQLATKADLRESVLTLKADLRESEAALKSDLRESEAALKSDLRESEANLKTELRDSVSVLRTDLRETEIRLEGRITDLAHKLDLGLAVSRAEIKVLEQRMTVKLGALVAAAVGILIAAIRYLPPAGH
ncbi:coiled-coil domain-containing protein [Methylobacterium tarhaniae]|uniref:coiled-coil domain-containing protein n=1 Tax=Methylobacterium tarhaniae TaxID=1187852 RepID=UPI003D05F526